MARFEQGTQGNVTQGFTHWAAKIVNTVKILCIGTDRSQQTVQTKIRLLLKKQSDQGLRCLPFHQHLLDALMQCYIKFFYFLGVPNFRIFTVMLLIEQSILCLSWPRGFIFFFHAQFN